MSLVSTWREKCAPPSLIGLLTRIVEKRHGFGQALQATVKMTGGHHGTYCSA
jgi:hypothetical protein